MSSKRRPGRPPGSSSTREEIATAARRQFAELGYERTTIRGVAQKAGVDPALVHHFFGSKQKLFLSVTELPFRPEETLPSVLAGRRSEAGLRLARFSVELWENPEAREVLTGILRAAVSEPEAAQMARELATQPIVGAITEILGADDAPLRANLISSQSVGLVMARYILRVEPIASMDPEALIHAMAPGFQHYLTRPLGPGA
jgi:AcrR family transcriptional regulator